MAETLDPYYRWLGIPQKHQPANHYRLLGVELFEDDPEVICASADRQMAHVRTYSLGQYAELSQKVLNELATARTCLLDSVKKAIYDEQFRRKSKPVEPDPEPTVLPPEPTALSDGPPGLIEPPIESAVPSHFPEKAEAPVIDFRVGQSRQECSYWWILSY